jgi:hypothetical protein
MIQLPRIRRAAWPLSVVVLALIYVLGAFFAQSAGPVCAVVPEQAAKPELGLLEGPPLPNPACIRVVLRSAD